MEPTRFPKSRGIILILVIMLLFSAFDEFSVPEARAATSGDYMYTVKDGKATITGYFGEDETVVIPSKLGGYPVVRIGAYAFADCYGISRVVFPDSVVSIGEGAFADVLTLTGVRFGSGLTSIGNNAFYYTDLRSLSIPDNVMRIGECAFQDCDSLTSVSLGSGVVSIGIEAFAGDSKLASITVASGNRVYSSLNGVLYNKDRTLLIQYPAGKTEKTYAIPTGVAVIGECAFENCNITGVTIPGSVTTINDGAFAFTDLTGVSIPDSVTRLGDFVFYVCDKLTGVTLGSGITSIADNTFLYCNAIQAFSVSGANPAYSSSNGVLFNKDKTKLALYPCGKSVTAYAVPDSVTTVGKYSFFGCENLTSVMIPDSVNAIDEGAFYDCSKLSGLSLGDGIASIGTGAFAYCVRLLGVDIPDSVKRIGESAFEGCYRLAAAGIGSSVEALGDYAFAFCEKLSAIVIPDSTTTMGIGVFTGCYALKSAENGDGLAAIPESAFEECAALRDVDLGNNLTSIGDWAFSGCVSLESVTIPESVVSIGYMAFTDCDSLSAAFFMGDAPQTQMYLFSGCMPGFSIYYLDGKSGFTNPWKGYPAAAFDPTFSYSVRFSLNEASGVPPTTQIVFEGVKAVKPGDPARRGYSFEGWYENADCTGTAWNFFDPIEKDMTLYAKWMPMAPTKPGTVKTASASYSSIRISWSASSFASGYHVYRTTSGGKILSRVATVTGSRTCTVTGLTCGSTYYFRVRAFRKTGGATLYSAYSSVVSAKPVPAKTDVRASLGPSMSVRLDWKAVAGATRYEIYRSSTKTGGYKRIGSTSLTRYRDAGVKPGARYYYKVRAVQKSGNRTTAGRFSSAVSQKLALAKPSAVVYSKDYQSIRLEWNIVKAADGYEIYRAASPGGKYAKVSTITSGDRYVRTEKGLKTGKTYYYKVRAYQKVGKKKVYGQFSAAASAKPVPAAPKNLKVDRLSQTGLKVVWDPVAGATRYEVRRSETKTGTYTLVAVVASCAFTDKGLPKGKDYYYKVRAYRSVSGAKIFGPFCAPGSP